MARSSTAQSFLTALIQGNTIGTSGVAQSGSRLGQGIVVDVRGEETAQFTIEGTPSVASKWAASTSSQIQGTAISTSRSPTT